MNQIIPSHTSLHDSMTRSNAASCLFSERPFLPKNRITWKFDLHEYSFDKGILFWGFIFYTLYYCGLCWPLLILKCCPKRSKKWPLIYNLNNRNGWLERLVGLIGFVVPFGLFSFLMKEDFGTLRPLVIALWMNTIFVIASLASMTAYTNKNASNLIVTIPLYSEEMESLKKIHISETEAELRETLNRLNINVSHLYFNYLQETRELREKMKRVKVEGVRSPVPTVTEVTNVEQTKALDNSRFEEKYLTRYLTELDNEKLFGYNLALDLLRSIEQPKFNAFKSKRYCLGAVVALILFGVQCARIVKSNSQYRAPLWGLAAVFFICFMITVFYILEIIYIGTSTLQRKKHLMVELGKLIDFGKCQIINIFDEMSMRTWMKLRKTFMHYGDRQMEIMYLIISGFIGLYLITVIAFLASYFSGGSEFLNDWYNNVELLNIGVIYLVLFVIEIIYLALSINMQFNTHRELIMENQRDVVEMYRLYPDYDAGRLKPIQNSFEDQAFISLKTKLPIEQSLNQIDEFPKKTLQDKVDVQVGRLNEVYDGVWRELKFEEKTHPIKLAGIKITPELVVALAAALGSALFNAIFSLFKKTPGE